MTENICLILMSNGDDDFILFRVLQQAVAAVDLHKRTVLYLGGCSVMLAKAGALETHTRDLKRFPGIMELFPHFQNAGGQLWVSSSDLQQMRLDPVKHPLIQGAVVVDDKTLLTFLTQDTLVLTF